MIDFERFWDESDTEYDADNESYEDDELAETSRILPTTFPRA